MYDYLLWIAIEWIPLPFIPVQHPGGAWLIQFRCKVMVHTIHTSHFGVHPCLFNVKIILHHGSKPLIIMYSACTCGLMSRDKCSLSITRHSQQTDAGAVLCLCISFLNTLSKKVMPATRLNCAWLPLVFMMLPTYAMQGIFSFFYRKILYMLFFMISHFYSDVEFKYFKFLIVEIVNHWGTLKLLCSSFTCTWIIYLMRYIKSRIVLKCRWFLKCKWFITHLIICYLVVDLNQWRSTCSCFDILIRIMASKPQFSLWLWNKAKQSSSVIAYFKPSAVH